jgi:hypothetical protein
VQIDHTKVDLIVVDEQTRELVDLNSANGDWLTPRVSVSTASTLPDSGASARISGESRMRAVVM